MAAFQQLVKLLPAVAGEELLKIDGGGAVGDVGNAGACVSKHSTDRTAHIPKVTTFVPPRRGPRPEEACEEAWSVEGTAGARFQQSLLDKEFTVDTHCHRSLESTLCHVNHVILINTCTVLS